MEKHFSESIKFLPEVDLTHYKPYPNSKHILEVKRLRPEHALALQKALNKGTEHIAGYFAWAETAHRWNTKNTLFWIQHQIRESLPSEHFAFFLGRDLVGMGSIRPHGHPRHVQMAYWVAKGYLKQGIGECIAKTIEVLALKYRPYQFIYIDHDYSNTSSGAIPKKLGYKWVSYYETEIHAKKETGVWYSWMKQSDRYSDCENERLLDLRYVDLWCQMMLEMQPEIYIKDYEELHKEARKEFNLEKEKVRTIDYPDAS